MREEKQSAQGEARADEMKLDPVLTCGWFSMLWCSHSVRRILFYGWHVYTAGILIGNIEGRTVQGAQKCPWCPCLPRKRTTLLTCFGSTLSFARPGRNNEMIWHFRLEAKCWYSKHLDHSCTRVVSTRKKHSFAIEAFRTCIYCKCVSTSLQSRLLECARGGSKKSSCTPVPMTIPKEEDRRETRERESEFLWTFCKFCVYLQP